MWFTNKENIFPEQKWCLQIESTVKLLHSKVLVGVKCGSKMLRHALKWNKV